MKKVLILASAFTLTATAVIAAMGDNQSAIDSRKALMQANGAAAGLAGAMMRQDIGYNPAMGKSVIATLNAVSHALPSFVPEGSTGEGTTAAPAIWEEADAWQKQIADWQADTMAAAEASGKDGPADLAAFQAAVGPVFENCKSCHERFRVKNN